MFVPDVFWWCPSVCWLVFAPGQTKDTQLGGSGSCSESTYDIHLVISFTLGGDILLSSTKNQEAMEEGITWTRVFSTFRNISTFLSIRDGFWRSNLRLWAHMRWAWLESESAFRYDQINTCNPLSSLLSTDSPALFTLELVGRSQDVTEGTSCLEVQEAFSLSEQISHPRIIRGWTILLQQLHLSVTKTYTLGLMSVYRL